MGCVLRQEHALLGCCIAADDDKDLFATEEFPIARRTVGNAAAAEVVLPSKARRARTRSGGEQDAEAREDALCGMQGLDVAAHVESSDLCYLEFCTKSFDLLAHVLSQGRSTDGRNARIIDDAICDGDLATKVFLLDHQDAVAGPCQIDGCCKAGRTAANHDDVVKIPCRSFGWYFRHQSAPTRSRLGFRVSAPGCHLAGQTSSPCSWTNWQACTLRSSSSALRPTLPALTS